MKPLKLLLDPSSSVYYGSCQDKPKWVNYTATSLQRTH